MDDYQGFIYEITNEKNGMKYIGSHVGSVEDSYLGSGAALIKDIKVYGTRHFTKAILEYVPDLKKIAAVETKWLLSVDAKNNPDYYNKTNNGALRYRKPKQKVRGICPSCKEKPVAIAYRRFGVAYYRNRCDQCYRKKRKPAPPAWVKSGYKKKERCEKCGFKFKFSEQSLVYHIDGNVENIDWSNLKTICMNCDVEIQHSILSWKPSALTPDF